MKLLLDQGLPRSAADALAARGHDAAHVGALGMASATDEEILERARREARTVVTLDTDFHALLALSNATAPSVVPVRVEGLRGEDLADLVVRVIAL